MESLEYSTTWLIVAKYVDSPNPHMVREIESAMRTIQESKLIADLRYEAERLIEDADDRQATLERKAKDE